jgi:hypothetical protein
MVHSDRGPDFWACFNSYNIRWPRLFRLVEGKETLLDQFCCSASIRRGERLITFWQWHSAQ